MAEQDELFGAWSQYFIDVSRFLENTEHHRGIANREFCDYVLPRLEVCLSTCMQLSDQMLQGCSEVGEEDELVINEFQSNLAHLLECLRSVHRQWVQYEEMLETSKFQYQAARRIFGRGRSKFEIEKEQLVYLSSLNFSWTEIAALLGVSCMTIYIGKFLTDKHK